MDAADLAGDTALHSAIREANTADAEAIAGALVLEGASLFLANRQCTTQLQLAIDRCRKGPSSRLVLTLLRHSAIQAPMVDDSAARTRSAARLLRSKRAAATVGTAVGSCARAAP
jgi:hypothetical protein